MKPEVKTMKIIEEHEIYGRSLLFEPNFNNDTFEKIIKKFKSTSVYENLYVKPTVTHRVVGMEDWYSNVTFTFIYKIIGAELRQIRIDMTKIKQWFDDEITPESEKLFVVKLYDGFDNEWMNVSEPISKAEANKIWNERTKNGTEKTKFDDGDYYTISPARR